MDERVHHSEDVALNNEVSWCGGDSSDAEIAGCGVEMIGENDVPVS